MPEKENFGREKALESLFPANNYFSLCEVTILSPFPDQPTQKNQLLLGASFTESTPHPN